MTMGLRARSKLAWWLMAISATSFLCLRPTVTYADKGTTQDAPADTVLLEIVHELRGMVPYRGKWLHFRLHQSGRVEYETLTESQENRELRPVRHETQLNSKDQREILRLIEARDFLGAREYYKELWPAVDTLLITTISSSQKRKKRIILTNFYSGARGYYPEAVVTLMRTIEGLLKTTRGTR